MRARVRLGVYLVSRESPLSPAQFSAEELSSLSSSSSFVRLIPRSLNSSIDSLRDPSGQSSEAAEKVLNDKRKTINGEDILYGMTALGFDNYAEACKVYLSKYRSVSSLLLFSISLPTHLFRFPLPIASPDLLSPRISLPYHVPIASLSLQ